MSLPGVVVLDDGRHDPGRIFAEVYDHTQPATGSDMLAIEPLPSRNWVQSMEIRSSDRAKNYIYVIEQPGPPTPQMQARASVENHDSSAWIDRLGMS
jgi:hypothetical protein